MTRGVRIWCVVGAVVAGCSSPPEFAIEIDNPTDCVLAVPEAASYWMALDQSGDRACAGGDCANTGDPRDCLASVVTPAVTPGETFTLTVGIYDDDGQLIACGRSDATTVDEGGALPLALSCDVAGCPNMFRLDCPDQAALAQCPVINGVQGAGACAPWEFVAWEEPCTDGYTRTRACDPAFDCRTSDLNGCDSPLNVELDDEPPPGCPACVVE